MNPDVERDKCPIDYLYDCRENFSIVALTGVTGCGCSEVAEMMADADFFKKKDYKLRNPLNIPFDIPTSCVNTDIYSSGSNDLSHKSLKQLIFRREYEICYNFIQLHYKPYTIIKYNKVLWLEVLKLMIEDTSIPKNRGTYLKDQVREIISQLYRPSYGEKDTKDKNAYDDTAYISTYNQLYSVAYSQLNIYSEWEKLYDEIKGFKDIENGSDEKISDDSKRECYEYFFNVNSALEKFYRFFNDTYSKIDYYCYIFFYHRLGFIIRATGKINGDANKNFSTMLDANANLFGVVKQINWLIKCIRAFDKKIAKDARRPFATRVCIDSLRNSIEAAFLRERYAAFYLIAINDEKRQDKLKHRIRERVFGIKQLDEFQKRYLAEMQEKSERLCEAEADCKQYENGQFAGNNIAQCIMDAEIHFVLPNTKEANQPMDFFSIGEQWMKYAALIFHPGLIAPSSEERCMEVAYNAKFNSGCLSRQVGAVITNKNHTIRTIGWNDVPYGQVPCSLRDVRDLLETTNESKESETYRSFMYSNFELDQNPCVKYKELFENKTFSEGMRLRYEPKIKARTRALCGMAFPYCFKDEHNTMLNSQNQVFTRSLHAEENAMMQMTKYGGESLMDGIIYVTASPCELCSKKLYQIGVRKIVYIDPYPGIAREHIVSCGFRRPELQLFKGAYGATFCKLYRPIMAYKDELAIRHKDFNK